MRLRNIWLPTTTYGFCAAFQREREAKEKNSIKTGLPIAATPATHLVTLRPSGKMGLCRWFTSQGKVVLCVGGVPSQSSGLSNLGPQAYTTTAQESVVYQTPVVVGSPIKPKWWPYEDSLYWKKNSIFSKSTACQWRTCTRKYDTKKNTRLVFVLTNAQATVCFYIRLIKWFFKFV